MAHHGGRTIPRTHRPGAPTPTPSPPPAIMLRSVARLPPAPQPLTAPLPPLRPSPPAPLPPPPTLPPQQPVVTLQAPRPDAERTTNEYVETPFRSSGTPAAVPPPLAPLHHHTSEDKHARPTRLFLPTGSIVTKQPVAFTKEHPTAHLAPNVGLVAGGGTAPGCVAPVSASQTNIICSECGRCRCDSCRTPRPLPSQWICDNTCLCSADAVVDYASCLCCVKALYYHFSDSDAGATCANAPCSCAPPRCAARWACMGALVAVLPCLLFYWPLRGLQRAVEATYARHSRAGCRCRPHRSGGPGSGSVRPPAATTPEKRLLDTSPDF